MDTINNQPDNIEHTTTNQNSASLNNKKNNITKSANKVPFWVILPLALVFGLIGGRISNNGDNSVLNSINSGQNTEVSQKIISNESDLIADIAENVGESVVSIDVESQDSFGSFFGNGVSQSAGTGFIISQDGIIATNKHVVPEDTSTISVTLSDGRKFDNVKVIGRDPRSTVDLAFIKIDGVNDLKPVKIGDSGKMRVGDRVVAIGNALGQFQNTVTTGIISGSGRPITASDGDSSESLSNLFQTDTAINPGNSGGPLVNVNSEVIGINTAVAGDAENIGFSIPINDVIGQINSVLKNGRLIVPYIGVRYVTITDDIAYEFNLPVSRGAYIRGSRGASPIVKNSPAEKAGLQDKDIIIKIEDIEINETNSLTNAINKFTVGDKVTLTIMRGEEEEKIDLTLEEVPTSSSAQNE